VLTGSNTICIDKLMNTIDELFDAIGGVAEVGRVIGKRTEHASVIKRRGSVPVRYWPALMAAAEEKGIALSYEHLVAIHSPNTNSEVAA
jgi:hypothetical protein